MIRLIITGTVSRCGQPVWATNYPRIYLEEEVTPYHHPDFLRMVDHRDVSLSTFSKLGDAYLFGKLTKAIRAETQAVFKESCIRQLGASAGTRPRNKFWPDKARPRPSGTGCSRRPQGRYSTATDAGP